MTKKAEAKIMTSKQQQVGQFLSDLDRGPRWEEFIDLLALKSSDSGCAGGEDKSLAIAILKKMGGIAIPDSLIYFEDHGGYCDCEIVLNCAI